MGINGTLAYGVCKRLRSIRLGARDSFPEQVRQSRDRLSPQFPTKTRRARTCPSRAALRTRPSSTAPSAPPTALARAPPPPPRPRPLPLRPVEPPHQTRAQRRARRGGTRPRHSRPAADGPAAGRGALYFLCTLASSEGRDWFTAPARTTCLLFIFDELVDFKNVFSVKHEDKRTGTLGVSCKNPCFCIM